MILVITNLSFDFDLDVDLHEIIYVIYYYAGFIQATTGVNGS